MVRIIEGESASEYVDPADLSPDHRIVRLPIFRRVATVSDLRIHRITVLKTEKTASRLRSRVEISRRKGERWQTEGVCSVRLLRRNHSAPWPLVPPPVARKRDGANNAVPIDNGRPHVKTEA